MKAAEISILHTVHGRGIPRSSWNFVRQPVGAAEVGSSMYTEQCTAAGQQPASNDQTTGRAIEHSVLCRGIEEPVVKRILSLVRGVSTPSWNCTQEQACAAVRPAGTFCGPMHGGTGRSGWKLPGDASFAPCPCHTAFHLCTVETL